MTGMQPPPFPGNPGSFTCPKCQGAMRTYNRNGVHIEQCDNCRGIFLDFGEFEHLSQLESRFAPAPPAHGHAPGWGSHGGHRYHKQGFARLFFDS